MRCASRCAASIVSWSGGHPSAARPGGNTIEHANLVHRIKRLQIILCDPSQSACHASVTVRVTRTMQLSTRR